MGTPKEVTKISFRPLVDLNYCLKRCGAHVKSLGGGKQKQEYRTLWFAFSISPSGY